MFPLRNIVPFGGYPPSLVFGGGECLAYDHHMGPPSIGHLHHHYPLHLLRHQRQGLSEIVNTKELVQVKVDVHQFSPDELTVKAVENFLVVEGTHDEKEDDHGLITRSFKRRYRLPDDINPDEFDERVSCELSNDGVLTIVIPRKKLEIAVTEGKVLPIKITGQPSKPTTN